MFSFLLIGILVVSTGVTFADSGSNQHVYKYGSDTLIFSGNNATLSLGSSEHPVSWNIYKINSNSVKLVKFTHFRFNKIDNLNQNSVILIKNNSKVKMTEIFTFYHNSIDASLAIKNLEPTNSTYEITFLLGSLLHKLLSVGGFLPRMVTNIGTVHNIGIPANDWSLTMGKLKVNWESEASLFKYGLVSQNGIDSILSLPFGPISLLPNQTFSVDPLISKVTTIMGVPQATLQKSNPIATPMYIPDGDGDGDVCHCDNDGGNGGFAPPTIVVFSEQGSYPGTFENGSYSMKLDYTINSLGTNHYADVGFFIQSSSGSYTQLGSSTVTSTGSFTFQVNNFNFIGQWQGFTIALYYNGAWHFGGSSGNSFIVYENTMYPYDYPNSNYGGGTFKAIYNSNGVAIGGFFANICYPNIILPGYTAKYSLSSGMVVKNNNYEVNKVSLYLNYTGNSNGQSPSVMNQYAYRGLQQYVSESSYQNYKNSSVWPIIDAVLYTAAFAAASALTDGLASALFAVGGVLNPFIFSHPTTQNAPSNIRRNLTWSQNAGWTSNPIPCYSSGYSYNALGTSYGGNWKSSYMFNVQDSMTFYNPTNTVKTPYVVDYMQYTMSYSIFNISTDYTINSYPLLYTGSYSVSVYLPEAVAPNS
jgi:hypothetical protein